MKKKIFIAAAVIISSTVHAQNEIGMQQDSAKVLKAVIVTANKIEQKQNETGKVLTVISQQELQRSAGKTIGEVLNRQVGVSVGGANGTLGTVQTLYTRGAAAANTLILMDGVPLYDGSGISSEFDLNSFVTDQIERIEILKGAQSTLYGSDAVAGVVNIITKKPAGKKPLASINLSAGSYNTYRAGVNLSGTVKKLEYFAGYSKVYSEGFSAAYDSTGKNNFDNDGFKQDAVLASIGYTPVKDLSLKIYGRYNINKAEIDAGAFADDNDYRYRSVNTVVGANVSFRLKKATVHFNYNFNDYRRKYNNDSADIGGYSTDPFAFYTLYIRERYKGKSHFAELYSNISLHKNINLVAGADHRTNATSQEYLYLSNYGPYEPNPLGEDTAKARQSSAYASLLYNNMRGFTAGFGGRFNDHSVYGSNGTYSINPAYTINRVKIFANISSGYRVPSLYQLYSEFGNRVLQPEESVTYEAGVQYSGKVFTGRAVGFKRDICDVFVFYTDPLTFQSLYINEDKQSDRGIELEASAAFSKFVLSANYTYVDGEIDTKNGEGKDTTFSNLYRRPKNLFNVSASYMPVPRAQVVFHVRSVSSFYEPKFGAALVRLSGYYTMDLYGEYRVNKQLKFFADFRNLTGQKYFDQEGFTTRGFNVTGGLNFRL